MAEEPVIPVPIPALVAILVNLERQAGRPLTREEVEVARDNCACVGMALSEARKLAESRGYDDIDPENVWEQWQEARRQLELDK